MDAMRHDSGKEIDPQALTHSGHPRTLAGANEA